MPSIAALTDNRLTALLKDAGRSLDRLASALCDTSPEARERIMPRLQRLADGLERLADDAEGGRA